MNHLRIGFIEMIWTAAKEPDLFNYEIERNQKMDEVLENEIEKKLQRVILNSQK